MFFFSSHFTSGKSKNEQTYRNLKFLNRFRAWHEHENELIYWRWRRWRVCWQFGMKQKSVCKLCLYVYVGAHFIWHFEKGKRLSSVRHPTKIEFILIFHFSLFYMTTITLHSLCAIILLNERQPKITELKIVHYFHIRFHLSVNVCRCVTLFLYFSFAKSCFNR